MRSSVPVAENVNATKDIDCIYKYIAKMNSDFQSRCNELENRIKKLEMEITELKK